MAKFKLSDYTIDFTTLIPATNRAHMSILHHDEVYISYGEYIEEKKRCKRVKIRIGNDILKQLKWSYKDKLQMFNFPDNLKKVVLVKKGSGCTAVTQNVKNPYWQFTLLKELSFKKSPVFSVDYEIHKLGYLIFNLEDAVIA